jgi:hypothetical protein
MHIGIVGGLDRAVPLLERIAAAAGHSVEFHTGRTDDSRGTSQIDALVDRAELVIVLTEINSHGGVQLARRLAARRGRRVVILRRLGAARFAELCATMEPAVARSA